MKNKLEFIKIKSSNKHPIGATHKPCPVCKFHKTFAGACCKECEALGYKLQPNNRIRRVL